MLPDSPAEPLPPQALIGGRFRVEATLGQGGMGAVYRVYDERNARSLALKQLRTGGQRDPAAAALMMSQFEREYHTLCQLAHPSIIEVYDYGFDGSAAFYTMELLDGQDLRERGQLPWRDACAVLRDVASSLAIMHSRRLLHRDISARNVRCTAAGKAKLIDFGAMAPMGLVKHVVGTAPFVPPEALRLQMLDGRADLYALGALAYWVLSGRYPYHARSFAELPDQWRNLPAPPGRYEPAIPEALDQLVMELIELDRNARPASAAEVMERLSGVAGLALRELPEVSRAYLIAPTLIARQTHLQAVRSTLVDTLRGKGGGAFLIEGAEGTGRSRLLDACVLEAKLLGATVLRADAADAERGEYGVARALCKQLFEELPQVAKDSARPWHDVLRRLLPELPGVGVASDRPVVSLAPAVDSRPPQMTLAAFTSRPPPASQIPPMPAERLVAESGTPQAALRDFVLSVARSRHLAIVVDDFEAVDAASAALLGALAHGAKRRRLTVLISVRTPAAPSPALVFLHELAVTLPVEPLTREQSETLLGSVFGEAGRLATLNERLFALAGGNLRWTMALCEHLVETGLARYEAGSWRLPSEIKPEDLPSSLGAAAASRIAGLPEDARALALALSLADPSLLSLDRYPLLTEHRDAGRVYRALDELVLRGVLIPHGDRYRFAQQVTADALRAGLAADTARQLHARLAHAYENCEDVVRTPYHQLLAGQDVAALDRMKTLRHDLRIMGSKVLPEALAACALAAERCGAPQVGQLDIRVGLLVVAVSRADHARFTEHAWPLFMRFARDSGLLDYQELDASMPPAARLQEAQRRCLARYELTPEAERGPPPLDAANCLLIVVGNFVAMASTAQDLEWVERLPSLQPLFPLLPALAVSQLQVDYQRQLQSGRTHLAQQTSQQLLNLLEQPDCGGFASSLVHGARCWELHNQGLFAAARGDRAALEWVAPLDNVPYYRTHARRVRMAYELMHGNVEAANSLRRRAELLALEDGIASILPGTSTRLELMVFSSTDDVMGVKRTLERLEVIAARFPNWRPTCEIARSQYQRITGDLKGARRTLAETLTGIAPGRHIDWGLAATLQVALFTASGDVEQAVLHGRAYIAASERESLEPARRALQRVVGEALTRIGQLEPARQMLDELLAYYQRIEVHGLELGLAYEACARLAIAAGDEDNVQHYAQLCAQEYKGARNPMLNAKYKGLIREAEAAGLAVTSGLLHALGSAQRSATASISYALPMTEHTLSTRLLGCVDRGERAREGLQVLVESTGAAGGFLFEVDSGAAQLLASIEESAPAAELLRALQSFLSAAVEPDDAATSFEAATDEPVTTPTFKDGAGRIYAPLSMSNRSDRGAGLLAVLRYPGGERRVIRRELLDALVEALTDLPGRS